MVCWAKRGASLQNFTRLSHGLANGYATRNHIHYREALLLRIKRGNIHAYRRIWEETVMFTAVNLRQRRIWRKSQPQRPVPSPTIERAASTLEVRFATTQLTSSEIRKPGPASHIQNNYMDYFITEEDIRHTWIWTHGNAALKLEKSRLWREDL